MAEEICRLSQDMPVSIRKIFSMGRHKDGIAAFGNSMEQTDLTLIGYLAPANAGAVAHKKKEMRFKRISFS